MPKIMHCIIAVVSTFSCQDKSARESTKQSVRDGAPLDEGIYVFDGDETLIIPNDINTRVFGLVGLVPAGKAKTTDDIPRTAKIEAPRVRRAQGTFDYDEREGVDSILSRMDIAVRFKKHLKSDRAGRAASAVISQSDGRFDPGVPYATARTWKALDDSAPMQMLASKFRREYPEQTRPYRSSTGRGFVDHATHVAWEAGVYHRFAEVGVALFNGGGIASGKTSAAARLLGEDAGLVDTGNDRYKGALRESMKRYGGGQVGSSDALASDVHEVAGQIAHEVSSAMASTRGQSFFHDATLADPRLILTALSAGNAVVLNYSVTSEPLAALRVLGRKQNGSDPNIPLDATRRSWGIGMAAASSYQDLQAKYPTQMALKIFGPKLIHTAAGGYTFAEGETENEEWPEIEVTARMAFLKQQTLPPEDLTVRQVLESAAMSESERAHLRGKLHLSYMDMSLSTALANRAAGIPPE